MHALPVAYLWRRPPQSSISLQTTEVELNNRGPVLVGRQSSYCRSRLFTDWRRVRRRCPHGPTVTGGALPLAGLSFRRCRQLISHMKGWGGGYVLITVPAAGLLSLIGSAVYTDNRNSCGSRPLVRDAGDRLRLSRDAQTLRIAVGFSADLNLGHIGDWLSSIGGRGVPQPNRDRRFIIGVGTPRNPHGQS